MAENKNSPGSRPLGKWVRVEDSPEVYSNQYYINWSVTDIRLRFGVMVPTDEDVNGSVGFVIEQQAAVTMSWFQAKALSATLNDAVSRYEKANGPIEHLKLKLPE